MKRRAQRGQALAELVMVLPLLLALLAALAWFAQAYQTRLRLVAMTRELAILWARADPYADGEDAKRRHDLKAMAMRHGLDPKRAEFKLEPLALPDAQGMGLGASLPWLGTFQKFLAESALGSRLTVRYRFQTPRLAAWAVGGERVFEEALAFKRNPWKHGAQTLITRMTN